MGRVKVLLLLVSDMFAVLVELMAKTAWASCRRMQLVLVLVNIAACCSAICIMRWGGLNWQIKEGHLAV
jgi:hypothetical protein